MSGVCCGDTEKVELEQGCAILRYPLTLTTGHHKRLVRVAIPNSDFYQPTFHYDCPENQLRALVNRVAGKIIPYDPKVIPLLRRASRKISHHIPPTVANNVFDMPKRYTGLKRARYERAAVALCMSGITRRDASVKAFVKAERFDGYAKINPDPRMIQFRASKYCVALAAFLHPIEHSIYHMDCVSGGVPRSRNVAKGLNSGARATLLHEKMVNFRRPIVLALDVSRFDKHVRDVLLQVEHSVYLRSNPSSYFRQLLSWQLTNMCFCSSGLKYKLRGKRCSGDMNTASGNCLIMCILILAYCATVTLLRWDFLDDGDDAQFIIEYDDLALVKATIVPFFARCGMPLKLEGFADCLPRVTFCQANPVEYTPGKWKFVRDPRAVISKALCGIRHWTNTTYRRRCLAAIGTCELILNMGVPVLQSWSLAVLRNVGRQGVDLSYAPDGLKLRAERDLRAMRVTIDRIGPVAVESCARATFALAFGIDEVAQVAFERQLESWTFDVDNLIWHGEEWDVCDWANRPSCTEVYARGHYAYSA